MLEWWLSLDPGTKLFYEWLAGMGAMSLYLIVSLARYYYKNYEEYLQGKEREPPAVLYHPDGRAMDGEQTILTILVAGIAVLIWPVSLFLFIAYKVRNLKLFTQILNPGYWIRTLAIKRNKTIVVTSPRAEIRALVGRSKRDE